MKLTLYGDTPSKKNSKSLVFRGGRTFIFSGKNYQSWHKAQVKELAGVESIKGSVVADVVIYSGTARKGDLTNKAESVMDLLVDCGIIEDDNWCIVPEVRLKYGGIDRQNPRAEITITATL